MRAKRSVTLIELMVVVVVLGILSTIAIPNVKNVKFSANTTALKADLGSISNAIAQEYLKSGAYPLETPEETIDIRTLPVALQDQIIQTGDNGQFLYEVDMDKVNSYLTQKSSFDNGTDKFILSALTEQVYYVKGISGGGTVYYGGSEAMAMPEKPSSFVTKIVAGRYGSYAIMYDGTVKSWSDYNDYGQMGIGVIDGTPHLPTKVPGLTNVIDIISNSKSTFAVCSNNGNIEYYAWGKNDVGQLGVGNFAHQSSPAKVNVLTNNVKKLLISDENLDIPNPASTYALMKDGTVLAWGANDEGDLGLGDLAHRNVPTLIPTLSNVRDIFINDFREHQSTYVVFNDNTVAVWGYNDETQLGLDWGPDYYDTPQINPHLTNVKEIDSNGQFGYALLYDKTVMVWGANWDYQLGLNDNIYRPTPVVHPYLSNVKELFINEEAAYAVLENNTLIAWGQNDYGQVGVNTVVSQRTPAEILYNVTRVYCENYTAFAFTSDGSIYGWGQNDIGQLGMGNTTNVLSPTKITLVDNEKDLSTMGLATYIVLRDGSVRYAGDWGGVLNWDVFDMD